MSDGGAVLQLWKDAALEKVFMGMGTIFILQRLKHD
jgi:hypothetical protein